MEENRLKAVVIFEHPEYEKQLINEFPEVEFTFYKSSKHLDEKLFEADILLSYSGRVSKEMIEKAQKLKWLMVLSAGVDQLPFDLLRERNIIVTNASGIHKIPIGEFVIGTMLSYVKSLAYFKKQQELNHWVRDITLGELYEKTLLVVGAGSIGSHIGKLAKAFGMKTIGINRSGRSLPDFDAMYTLNELNQVLPLSDFVVSVLPSTKETQNVFTMEQFKRMKTSAVFINVGRGDAVDEDDLLTALNDGEIAHAILDVFREEPLPSDHPFWTHEKVTISPHVVGITARYLERALVIFKDNLRKYLNKEAELQNMIDLERRY